METDLLDVVKMMDKARPGTHDSIAHHCASLIRTHHAEIQRNAEDAARYRWLRNEKACTVDFSELRWLADEEFDESIDAAMRSANGMESV
jgi:hypothetical protein